MGKALYSEFKSVVDQINAFRTGTLGMASLTLSASPAAAQGAKMTAAQVNELQNQSAALSNYITTSASRCSYNSGVNSSVRSYNYSHLDSHKNTVNPSNLRDNSTYYSGYLDAVLYFNGTFNNTVYSDLRMTRYNGHNDAYYSGYCGGYRNAHYENRAGDNTSKDSYNFQNSYLSTDDTSVRAYDSYNTSNYGHNSSQNTGYYSSRRTNHRSYNVTVT